MPYCNMLWRTVILLLCESLTAQVSWVSEIHAGANPHVRFYFTTKHRMQYTLQELNYVKREVLIHIQPYCLGIKCAVHKHTGVTSYSRINVSFGHMIRVILEIINNIFSFVLWFVDLGVWFFSTQNIYYFRSTLLLVKEHNKTF